MVVAGVLSLESALILVAERGRLMFERCTLGSSGMLAIRASPFQIKKDLEEYKDLTIACYNR